MGQSINKKEIKYKLISWDSENGNTTYQQKQSWEGSF